MNDGEKGGEGSGKEQDINTLCHVEVSLYGESGHLVFNLPSRIN